MSIPEYCPQGQVTQEALQRALAVGVSYEKALSRRRIACVRCLKSCPSCACGHGTTDIFADSTCSGTELPDLAWLAGSWQAGHSLCTVFCSINRLSRTPVMAGSSSALLNLT